MPRRKPLRSADDLVTRTEVETILGRERATVERLVASGRLREAGRRSGRGRGRDPGRRGNSRRQTPCAKPRRSAPTPQHPPHEAAPPRIRFQMSGAPHEHVPPPTRDGELHQPNLILTPPFIQFNFLVISSLKRPGRAKTPFLILIPCPMPRNCFFNAARGKAWFLWGVPRGY